MIKFAVHAFLKSSMFFVFTTVTAADLCHAGDCDELGAGAQPRPPIVLLRPHSQPLNLGGGDRDPDPGTFHNNVPPLSPSRNQSLSTSGAALLRSNAIPITSHTTQDTRVLSQSGRTLSQGRLALDLMEEALGITQADSQPNAAPITSGEDDQDEESADNAHRDSADGAEDTECFFDMEDDS